MSVFTSFVTETLHVPGLPADQAVTIRKLAPKALKAARKEALLESIRDFRQMGGAEFQKELQAIGDAEAVKQAIANRDPLGDYSPEVLIAEGVVSWTLTDPSGQPVPREAFAELDEDTQDWLARAILRLAKPSLFQSAAEVEAERKNG